MSQTNDYKADRPIESSEQDKLGRGTFANAVATVIAGRKGKESYVIGLYGSWGSGKSSLKNMILEILRKEQATCPTIIEFNPWQFKDTELLTQSFFSEIAGELGKPVEDHARNETNKQRAAKWKQLGSLMSVGGDVIVNLAKVAKLCGVPFTDLGHLAGEALKESSKLTKESADSLNATVEHSLSQIKNEIRESMKDLDNPVLVVLDDIDRLSASEMALLFHLVKVNGDFPNLIYLLLFQRDIVEASLNKVAPNDSGAAYLEKIVQVGLDIPAIGSSTLYKMFVEKIKTLFGMEALDRTVSDNGLTLQGFLEASRIEYVPNTILSYINNLRDLYRYMNSLEFQIELLTVDGVLQASPVDLISLEVLRVFEPEVYNSIPKNKDLFTYYTLGGRATKPDIDNLTPRYEKILEQGRNTTIIKNILKFCFPRVSGLVGDLTSGIDISDMVTKRAYWNVCHPSCFDRYFQLVLPEQELSAKELYEIKELLPDQTAFSAKIAGIHSRGLLRDLTDHLLGRSEIMSSIDQVKQVFFALSQAEDEHLPPSERKTEIVFFVKNLLQSGQYTDELFDAIRDWCSECQYLYLPCSTLGYMHRVLTNKTRSYYRDFGDNDTKASQITSILLEKIQHNLSPSHPRCYEILEIWLHNDNPQNVSDWLEQNVGSHKDVLLFLMKDTILASSAPFIQNRYMQLSAYLIGLYNASTDVLSSEDQSRIEPLIESLRASG